MQLLLNQEQSEAVAEFQTDLLVTAAAGTGKTRVLSSKYLRLLEERRATVATLVAITFTNKAAVEMRQRIEQGIREKLHQRLEPKAELFWQEQLELLPRARISTFHQLCLGILREHPVEAGISPIQAILGEGEARLLVDQAVRDAIAGLVPVISDPAELTSIMLEFGWDRLLDSLAQIYPQLREAGRPLPEIFRISATQLAAAKPPDRMGMDHLVAAIVDLLEYASNLSLSDRAQTVIGELRENWPEYRMVLSKGNPGAEILPLLAELRRALPGNLPNLLKPRVAEVHQLLEDLTQQLLNQIARRRIALWEQLFNEIDREYTKTKLEVGLLDFTDQLLLTRNLLRDHPQLAAEIRSGIDYLLVDEFQDSNRLQLELIDQLRGNTATGGRMMAVGDIKQSIYRFRGAEPELMQLLEQRLQAPAGRVLNLSQNYRSSDVILNFVNRISGSFFADEPFEYQPLQAAKPTESAAPIELVLTGSRDCYQEARLVARKIKQLVQATGDAAAAFDYGQIALLFRAGTNIELYQQALQELEIPYYSASGRGFYHCQEVVDQLNLLRLIEQSNDGIALVALLKSPYLGWSDASLYWLAAESDLVTQFYQCNEFAGSISAREREVLIRFRELLGFFQLNRNYFSIAQILRAFSEQFNYREILWSQPNAGQRLANLEKLLDQADQFTAKGYHDLYRFLDYLEQLQEAEVLEGEAPTQAEMGAAVRLMTIHRAKGLEFPVVILPDLDRQFLTLRERLIWHKDCGIEAGLSVTDGKIGWSILGKAIRERHQRENLAEMKRLFYVALTRAEERLVLVGSGCSRSKADSLASADSWMKWLELLLPLAEQTGPFDYQGVPLLITREVPEAVRPAPRGTLLEEYLAQPTAAPLDLAVATSTPVNSAADSATTVLKVSEFLAFQACPRRYYWEYRWRLPQQATLGSEGAAELGGALGRFAGEFFHRAARLQQPEWPETLWQRLSRELSPADRQLLKPDLLQMWQNFRASGYTEQAGRCWDEVPFQIKLQKGLAVEGRFDRLLEKSSQMRTLVDYKTHRIKAAAVAELGPAYFSQLQLYALAVAVLWGELPGTAMLYFPYSDQGIAVPLNEVDRERVRSEVAAMADFISQHQLPQEYPATGDCRRCGYQSLCRSDS